jgi:hypothetical protein
MAGHATASFAADPTAAILVLPQRRDTFETAATLAAAVGGPALGHLPAFLGGQHKTITNALSLTLPPPSELMEI